MRAAGILRWIRFVPTPCLWSTPAVLVLEHLNHDRAHHVNSVQWTTTIDGVNGVYLVLAPLAAGSSALAYGSVSRHREMIGALPDGGLRAYAMPTLVTAGFLSALHALCLVWVILVDRGRGVPGIPFVVPTVVVVAALFAASGVGAVIARIGDGSRLAAPLAAALVYGYEIFEHQVASRLFSDFGGASELLLGQRQRLDVIAIQSLCLGLIAALLIGIAVWGWRAGPRIAVGVSLWLSMAASTIWLANLGDHRFEESGVSWVCSPGTPKVCIAREFGDELDYFTPRVQRYAAELHGLGLPVVPTEFRQSTGEDRPAMEGSFVIDHQAPGLAYSILASSLPCIGVDDWTNRVFRRSDVVVSYLAGDEGTPVIGHRPATRRAAARALAELAC